MQYPSTLDLYSASQFWKGGSMNKLEEKIYNKGERCIPGVTHDEAEAIRHRNRYLFFKKVIADDLNKTMRTEAAIKILDLGCGVGYGCKILASIPNVLITGIDISIEAIKYAQENYAGLNISYHAMDTRKCVSEMESFDYVVSSGVIEHIKDGFQLLKDVKFKRKMMISTPYKEKPGNVHHVLLNINRNIYDFFPKKKFYYDDWDGNIFNRRVKIWREIFYKNLFISVIRKLLDKKQKVVTLSLICVTEK